MDQPSPHRPSLAEAFAHGRSLRARLPRSAHAQTAPRDRDPLAILVAQNATRLPHLVGMRMGRMAQSPFAYYRGSAAQMAADLWAEPHTDTLVLACGDAHVANFGLYASPERRLVFDLNDFDEAGPAPWEWDVKRLGASIVLAGRDIGMAEDACRQAVETAVRRYRVALAELFERSALDRFYASVEVAELHKRAAKGDRRTLRRAERKARRRTSDNVLTSITAHDVHGRPRIVDQPPIVEHVGATSPETARDLWRQYRHTANVDVSVLLEQFDLVDVAMRVVGVGSVGTRCHILLALGPADEPLFLQVKEAAPSALVTYGGMPPTLGRNAVARTERGAEGQRVVIAQRVLQAVSDPFLGWLDHEGRHYYVRQFRDMKGSLDLEDVSADVLTRYGALCGGLLARAHAQSPDAAVVRGYVGSSDALDEAVARWSTSYADQAEADHAALVAGIRSGRIPAEDVT